MNSLLATQFLMVGGEGTNAGSNAYLEVTLKISDKNRAQEFLNPEKVVIQIGLSPLIDTKFLGLLVNSFKAKNKSHEEISQFV